MTRCTDVDKLVTSYIDGDIDEHRARAVRGHARECARCARLLEDESAVATWLGDLDSADDPPEHLWADIQRRLATEEHEDARRSHLGLWWSNVRQHAVPAVLVAATLVVGVGSLLGPGVISDAAVTASAPDRAPTEPAPRETVALAPGDVPDPTAATFADERREQLADADRHFREAVAELRAEVGAAANSGELAAELERLDGELTRARSHVGGEDALAARDEVHRLYLEEIALLQDAALEGDWM